MTMSEVHPPFPQSIGRAGLEMMFQQFPSDVLARGDQLRRTEQRFQMVAVKAEPSDPQPIERQSCARVRHLLWASDHGIEREAAHHAILRRARGSLRNVPPHGQRIKAAAQLLPIHAGRGITGVVRGLHII